jgi:hypothetical protein
VTTTEPYTDLYVGLNATICSTGKQTTPCTMGLFWANTRPSEVRITVRTGPDNLQTWTVGRALFIAAGLDWYRGAWAGGGDFGICYTKDTDKAMLAFKPTDRPDQRAIVIAGTAVVEDFVQHTAALVPPGDAETLINLAAVDAAIGKILAAS